MIKSRNPAPPIPLSPPLDQHILAGINLTQSYRVNGILWRPNPDTTVKNTAAKGALVCTFAVTPHAAINGMVAYNRQETALDRTQIISWLSNTYTGHIVLYSAAYAREMSLEEAHQELLDRTKTALELMRLDLP